MLKRKLRKKIKRIQDIKGLIQMYLKINRGK